MLLWVSNQCLFSKNSKYLFFSKFAKIVKAFLKKLIFGTKNFSNLHDAMHNNFKYYFKHLKVLATSLVAKSKTIYHKILFAYD